MKFKYLLLGLTALLLLNSCGSSSDSQTFTLEEKKFVHTLFSTEYLWYDKVVSESEIEYAKYTQPKALINRLKVTPPDQWSFMMTQQQYEDFVNQKTIGFGFGYTEDLKVFMVRIDSPAYKKLQRGDKIIKIDGEEASFSLIKKSSKETSKPTLFTVLRDGTIKDISILPSAYSFKVSFGKIILHEGKKIGYLRYDSFTGSSVAEFETIFTKFHNENIDELVIDLRYNGGGSLSAASALLDNIISGYPEQRQMYLSWNEKMQNKNRSYSFEESDLQDGNELNMQRVVFLVTKHSASASEALINAIKPYVGHENTITIGEETKGKPVGMSGRTYGNDYYFLINFFVKNNSNEVTSFDGIPTTCQAEDDIDHLLGDKDETMLQTALYYLQNNRCP